MGATELDRVRRLADQVDRGFDPADLVTAARAEFIALFDLLDCRYEPAPFDDGPELPTLRRDGTIRGLCSGPGGRGVVCLVPHAMAVPVMSRGRVIGRFVLDAAPGTTASLDQRVVAVALADQVGPSLALDRRPLSSA